MVGVLARVRGPLVVAGLGAGALVLLWARDPETQGPYPVCLSALLLGIQCPFCGALRGVHDLVHGDVSAMAQHNLLLPLYLIVSACAFLWWIGDRIGYRPRVHPRVVSTALIVVLVVSVGFGILRNLVPALATSAGL